NNWATAVMIFTYDNNRVANLPLVTNSRVQISRGFVTLGDLNKFPMYLTVGQMYVPFGNYGSYMVNNPPTYYLAKTKERAALLGFAKYGIYASVYGYKGEVTTFKTQDASRYLGVNVGYKFSKDKFSADVAFGYIGDIAESAGMQSVFTNAAYGVNDALQHTVGGASARVKLGLDRFTLIGEYESAVRSFAAQDMTFNHKGAVPKALETELVYSFPILGKPNNIGIGYGRSWESLALSIPEQDYFAVFSTSIFRSTIESIEFRHDINYKSTDTSSVGKCVIPSTPRRDRNVVTLQIGIYF
ncbi:MAG: LbtU family siderophore porin, partial [Gammaproteobacteria bacterium]|nr:LbtU family siderophore porin [Gammaproteobacteria bacterium]